MTVNKMELVEKRMRKISKSALSVDPIRPLIVLITVHAALLLGSLLTHTSHHLLVLHHWSLEIVLSHLKIYFYNMLRNDTQSGT